MERNERRELDKVKLERVRHLPRIEIVLIDRQRMVNAVEHY